MRRRIIIKEQQITRAGQLKHFQIALPKNTKKVIAVATDVRFASPKDTGSVSSPVPGSTGRLEEATPRDGDGSIGDTIWNMRENPLMGKLIMQSMEKANIFFYDQVWAITFDDGITELNSVESMNAFAMLIKKEPKAVDVPNDTTVLNCLYKDQFMRDTGYVIKVLVWIEYEEK